MGDDILCGLVGRESRLSKLPLLRSSGGVVWPVDEGRSIGDDPSVPSCSGRTRFSDDRPTADVSIVMVGALARRLGPGDDFRSSAMLVSEMRAQVVTPDDYQGFLCALQKCRGIRG